ncbi:MAG TPA: hypothetical protein VE130_08795 [Nitrososphaeraceae archaeon]|nr:hypothetical protein [Nitrososphaeraceae archaeon]
MKDISITIERGGWKKFIFVGIFIAVIHLATANVFDVFAQGSTMAEEVFGPNATATEGTGIGVNESAPMASDVFGPNATATEGTGIGVNESATNQ